MGGDEVCLVLVREECDHPPQQGTQHLTCRTAHHRSELYLEREGGGMGGRKRKVREVGREGGREGEKVGEEGRTGEG